MAKPSAMLAATLAMGLQALGPAAAGACTIPTNFAPGSIVVEQNLPYTTAPNALQELDLYLPVGVSQPPVIVAVHGGGFYGGSKAGYKLFGEVMASFGIATAAVNYRLARSGTNLFPAGISDVRCAVSWLSANATALGIDGSRVAMFGGSAGGNLAGLVGTHANPKHQFDATTDCAAKYRPPPILAVADYFGLNDINARNAMNKLQTNNVKKYLGVDPRLNEALAASASPRTYVASDTPPFFIARGTADTKMPELQADDLVLALQAARVSEQYWDIPGLGHGFDAVDVATYPVLKASACALVGFFRGVFAGH